MIHVEADRGRGMSAAKSPKASCGLSRAGKRQVALQRASAALETLDGLFLEEGLRSLAAIWRVMAQARMEGRLRGDGKYHVTGTQLDTVEELAEDIMLSTGFSESKAASLATGELLAAVASLRERRSAKSRSLSGCLDRIEGALLQGSGADLVSASARTRHRD
ncbi:MAG: hypothetical protein D6773_06600 [Alphaproteobacteria bacterium]|nr:MAG: hypothetical protein D6773_06600 [Alphaproteobacteria bacterium]